MAAHPVVCCGAAATDAATVALEVGRREEETNVLDGMAVKVKGLEAVGMFTDPAMAPAAREALSKTLMEGILAIGNGNERLGVS